MSIEKTTAPGGARLDEWTCISLGPTAVPNESRLRGSVFRGVPDLAAAKEYADRAHAFLQANGAAAPVFVVKGPTSTTRSPFEVVSATCGHEVLYQKGQRAEPSNQAPGVADEASAWPRERG